MLTLLYKNKAVKRMMDKISPIITTNANASNTAYAREDFGTEEPFGNLADEEENFEGGESLGELTGNNLNSDTEESTKYTGAKSSALEIDESNDRGEA